MNHKYVKLAKQADVWCDFEHTGSDFYDLFWEEKFAELIVRECMELCRKQSLHYADINNQGSASSAADVCRIIIKQHFGVEE